MVENFQKYNAMNVYKKIFTYFKKLNIYKNIPIYNINWLKKKKFNKQILGDENINFVDVGARGGSSEELSTLVENISYIGFDADKEEILQLENKNSIYKNSKYICCFVGGEKKTIEFNLYKKPEASSIYFYKDEYIRWFQNDNDYIEKKIEVESDTLDNLIKEDIDILKLDTQGNEYEILQGAKKSLNKTLIVETETMFYQIYSGQKLAPDIMNLMSSHGFDILYINRVFSSSKDFNGLSRGQITFGEILFGLNREKALKLSTKKKLRYCILLINFGHIDFAFDIFKNSEDLKNNYPKLDLYFKSINIDSSKFSKLLRFTLDKILYLFLFLRKTNGLKGDSDRSWPIR